MRDKKQEFFEHIKKLFSLTVEDCSSNTYYFNVITCECCQKETPIIYNKPLRRFVCQFCKGNPLSKTEAQWAAKNNYLNWFETKEEMMEFSEWRARKKFNELIKTNPRIWEVGLKLSIMKHIARANNVCILGCCGLCFAYNHLFPNDTSKYCDKCLYYPYRKASLGRSCGMGGANEVLKPFLDPEFMVRIKKADDELEMKHNA